MKVIKIGSYKGTAIRKILSLIYGALPGGTSQPSNSPRILCLKRMTLWQACLPLFEMRICINQLAKREIDSRIDKNCEYNNSDLDYGP